MRKFLAVAFLHFAGCSAIVLSHDEDLAAKRAIEWARVALLNQDSSTAYGMLSEETKKNIPWEKFTAVMEQMHPQGFPAILKATKFEPMPGQRAMSIILEGENSGQMFYYRLVMMGTAERGYTVGAFLRSNGPYPGNPQMKGASLLQPSKSVQTVSAS